MEETRIWHGGDLGEARALFPDAPEPWIDLSTGINPIAYPIPSLPASAFMRLPEPGDHDALEEAAAEAYGVADPAHVVAAPGTQVLISLLPFLVPRGEAAVVTPTYGEHARAWRAAGHAVREIAAPAEGRGAGVLVLVNPNNPDGGVSSREALRALAAERGARGALLVVDEAFADFDAGESLAPDLPEGVLVLRSFGKTYGLAGVRLGFALGRGAIGERLRAGLGPWAVSGPALAVGRAALADGAWREAAARARKADAARLDALLAPLAGTVVGTTLFRTIEIDRAPEIFDALGRAGIWVRRFQDDPRRLRFGLPGDAEAWARVEGVLLASSSQARHFER